MRLRFALSAALLLLATAAAPAARAEDDRVSELARKVDALTQEIESLRMGAAAETTRYEPRLGLGPAASKVYERAEGVSIGGYGEMLLQKLDRENEDGAAVAGPRTTLDFLRAVFYVGYKFADDLLFNSEIELEHAGVFDEAAVEVDPATGEGEAELSGEARLEFAYAEWSPRREIGVRAGMLLVPLGLTNELHEPPVFLGARRPEVERNIIPATWGANGAGLVGELSSGLAYRAYVLEGLDAAHFSAASAIRGGRQGGSQSVVTHPAFTARVDWTGTPGVLVGASGYTGESWQGPQPAGGSVSPRVTLFDLHGRVEWRGLQARALWAQGMLDGAGELSDALGLTGDSRLGERFSGAFVEAGVDLMPRLRSGSRGSAIPYARYEMYDTQEVVPGGSENPANERRIVTAGIALKPHPNVVLKADREWRHNEADTGAGQWNAAVGYLF